MAADYNVVLIAPFGALGVRTANDAISEIAFLPPGTKPLAPRNALAAEVCAQLAAYLADPESDFSLPLMPAGTEFQRRVWQSIAAIPRGRTRTYGEIAGELKNAPRAVGQACGRNPFPVVVPCHRVVGANDSLGGFARKRDGFLLDVKRWLLRHEGAL